MSNTYSGQLQQKRPTGQLQRRPRSGNSLGTMPVGRNPSPMMGGGGRGPYGPLQPIPGGIGGRPTGPLQPMPGPRPLPPSGGGLQPIPGGIGGRPTGSLQPIPGGIGGRPTGPGMWGPLQGGGQIPGYQPGMVRPGMGGQLNPQMLQAMMQLLQGWGGGGGMYR